MSGCTSAIPSGSPSREIGLADCELDRGCVIAACRHLQSRLGEEPHERLKPELELLGKLQARLFDYRRLDDYKEWICPGILIREVKGLIGEKREPDADQLIVVLLAGTEHLERLDPQSKDLNVVQLRIDTLSTAYNVACNYEMIGIRQALLPALARAFFDKGNLLDGVNSYHLGFRNATLALNIALSACPDHGLLWRQMGEVEGALLRKLGHLNHVGRWAEQRLFPDGPSDDPELNKELCRLAWHLHSLGEREVARDLYMQCHTHLQRLGQSTQHLGAPRLAVAQGIKPNDAENACRKLRSAIADIRRQAEERYQASLDEGAEEIDVSALQLSLQKDIAKFSAILWRRACALFNIRIKHALVGLGSLARGEPNPHSDLDAILLVPDGLSAEDREDLKRAAWYFDFLILSLGETEGTLVDKIHLHNGFHLDPAALHPGRIMHSPTTLMRQVREGGSSLQAHDIDPVWNALRLPCLISGDTKLFDQSVTSLNHYMESHGEESGDLLVRWWVPPPPLEDCIEIKNAVFRPTSLLIDALATRFKLTAISTTKRLEALQALLPYRLYHYLALAYELTCKLRMQAHFHYGRDCERVYVRLPAESEIDHPLILEYPDYQLLRRIHTELFAPLAEDRLQVLNHDLPPPPEPLEAPQVTLPVRFQALQPLARLLLQSADAPPRPNLPNPPEGIFSLLSPSHERRRLLFNYLSSLELPNPIRTRAWSLGRDQFYAHGRLQESLGEVICQVLGMQLDKPTLRDLVYGDLLLSLSGIAEQLASLPIDQQRAVVIYLLRHFPRVMRERLHERLRAMGLAQSVEAFIPNYPDPNGGRPYRLNRQTTWDDRHALLEAAPHETDWHYELLSRGPALLSKQVKNLYTEICGQSQSPFGRRHVGRMGNLMMKLHPEAAGAQKAHETLYSAIVGVDFPRSELLRLRPPKADATFVTLQEFVSGPTLHEVLRDDPKGVHKLDFAHYSLLVLLTLVVFPEDDKADNFIAQTLEGEGTIQIIPVDTERNFSPAFEKRTLRRDRICLKSILLCMNEMRWAIHPEAREIFLALQAGPLLQNLLNTMAQYNNDLEHRVGIEEIEKQLANGCHLPFLLQPTLRHPQTGQIVQVGLIAQLFERVQLIQKVLRADPNVPLFDLLQVIDRDIAARYHAQLETDRPFLERFAALSDGQYAYDFHTAALTTQTDILRPHKTYAQFIEQGWGVDSAKVELQQLIASELDLKEIAASLSQRVRVDLELVALAGQNDRLLSEIDFTTIDPPRQHWILTQFGCAQFTRLDLTGCTELTDDLLQTFIGSSPHLQELILRNCPRIKHLNFLHACPRLRKLILSGAANLETLSYNSFIQRNVLSRLGSRSQAFKLEELRTLDISHCPKLREVNLETPQLRHLLAFGKSIPARLDITLPGPLPHLSVDSEASLERYQQFQPVTITWEKLTVRHISERRIARVTSNLSAITRQGAFIIYRRGPLDIPLPTVVSAIRGQYTYFLSTGTGGLRTECLVRPFGRRDDSAMIQELLQTYIDKRSSHPLSSADGLLQLDLPGVDRLLPWHPKSYQPQLQQLGQLSHNLQTIRGSFDLWKSSPNLTRFEYDGYSWNADTTRELFRTCPGLTALSLVDAHVGDETVSALSFLGTHLVELSIRNSAALSKKAIRYLTQGYAQLTSLDLSGCSGIRGNTDSLVKRHSGLNSLNLRNCRALHVGSTLFDHCPQLRLLRLKGSQPFFESCKPAPKQSSALTNVDYFSNSFLRSTRLQELTIQGQVSDGLLQRIAQRLTRLTNLSMPKKRLSALGLRAFLTHCPSLTALKLTNCRYLTDADIEPLAPLTSNLRELDLRRCELLTDKALIALALHATRLEELKIGGHWARHVISHKVIYEMRFSDEGVVPLICACTRLRTLSLSGLGRVTDRTIEELAQHSTALCHLNIRMCMVSQESIPALFQRFTLLRTLQLGRHMLLQMRGVRRAPDLEVIACERKEHESISGWY